MNIDVLKLEFELVQQHLNRVDGIRNQLRALAYKTWLRQQLNKEIDRSINSSLRAYVNTWAAYTSRAYVIDADNHTPEEITRIVKKARETMPDVPFIFECNPKVREILRICIQSALNEDLIDQEDFEILSKAGYLTTED